MLCVLMFASCARGWPAQMACDGSECVCELSYLERSLNCSKAPVLPRGYRSNFFYDVYLSYCDTDQKRIQSFFPKAVIHERYNLYIFRSI